MQSGLLKAGKPLLYDSFRKKLFAHIYSRFRETPFIVDAVGGVKNHVHCLVFLSATYTVAKAMKDIKGESSGLINSSLWVEDTFFWQEGYGAFSVSPSQLAKVRNYIYHQEQHHFSQSFDEELRLFENSQQRGN